MERIMHVTLTRILQTNEQPPAGSTAATGISTRIVQEADRTVVEIVKGDQVVFSVGVFDTPAQMSLQQ